MGTIRYHSLAASGVTVHYDRGGDVLYVALGKPRPAEGEDRPQGIILRFGIDDDAPCGVTVLGYHRNGWDEKVGALSKLIADHILVKQHDITTAIRNEVGQ